MTHNQIELRAMELYRYSPARSSISWDHLTDEEKRPWLAIAAQQPPIEPPASDNPKDDMLTEVGHIAMQSYEKQRLVMGEKRTWDEIHPDDREAWRAEARKQIREGHVFRPPTPASAPDPIKPSHYKHGDAYEALRVMLEWHGKDAVVNFCHLTAEKYLARAGKKSGEPMERDFRKAAFYLTHAAELLEKK